MVRLVSLAVILTLIVILGVTFFRVVAPFILPLFLAGVAALLCQPSYGKLVARLKGRGRIAAGLMTAGVLLVILVPAVTLIVLASLHLFSTGSDVQVSDVQQKTTRVIDVLVTKAATSILGFEDRLPSGLKFEVTPEKLAAARARTAARPEGEKPAGVLTDALADEFDDLDARIESEGVVGDSDMQATDLTPTDLLPFDVEGDPSGPAVAVPLSDLPAELQQAFVEQEIRHMGEIALTEVGEKSLGFAGRTLNEMLGAIQTGLAVVLGAILGLAMFGISLYYFLADGPQMLRSVQRLVPVQVQYQQTLLHQFASVVRSVVIATFLAALVQAVMCTAALALCGIPHLVILFVLALVGSMIPLAGTWLVWAPVAVYLFIDGRYFAGTLLTIWGAGVIGVMDNVVRTYVLGAQTKLHPLLAFVSVLGGLQVMGLWGIFVGPIVASCLHALIEIFNQELAELSKERFDAVTPEQPEGRRLEAAAT